MALKIKNILKRILPLPAKTQNAGFARIEFLISQNSKQIDDALDEIKKIKYEIDVQNAKLLNTIEKRNAIVLSELYNQKNKINEALTESVTSLQNPKVSVVIPVYNAAPYLPQCLDSLRVQTLRDFEIICVNDGSVDGSVDIMNYYEKSDPRIKIIYQEKLNAGVARNNGMKIATGEYLMFLDADDFFEPSLLQHLYDNCEAFNSDICLYTGTHYDNKSGIRIPASYFLRNELLPMTQPFSKNDCPEHIFQITSASACTKMFKKSFVENNNLQFQSLKKTNDLLFAYSAIALADRISVCNESLLNYRVNVDNSIQASHNHSKCEFFKALSALKNNLTDYGIYDELKKSFQKMAVITTVNYINVQPSTENAREIFDAFIDKYAGEYEIELDELFINNILSSYNQQSNSYILFQLYKDSTMQK